jgi:hypothetical protein
VSRWVVWSSWVDLTGDSDGLNLPETANLQDGSGSPRELRSFTTGIFFTAHSVRGILPSGSTAIRSVITASRPSSKNTVLPVVSASIGLGLSRLSDVLRFGLRISDKNPVF